EPPLLDELARLSDAVRAHDLELGIVPQHDVAVVGIEGVDVAALAGALARLTERDLPQTSELAQHRAIGYRVEQHDLFPVGGLAEDAAALQRAPEREPVFGPGDWCLGAKPEELAFPRALRAATEAPDRVASAQVQRRDVLRRDRFRDADPEDRAA